MKKVFALFLSLCFISHTYAQNGSTCDPAQEKVTRKNSKPTKGSNYGAVITTDGAIDVKTLTEKMKDVNELAVKITGDVQVACQVKGCWMTADLGNGQSMRIRFKDYAFFVPKDSNGKRFYAEGVAKWNTTSVEQLRHYAEDAGKSKEEMEKITEPKKEITFLASGVILQKK